MSEKIFTIFHLTWIPLYTKSFVKMYNSNHKSYNFTQHDFFKVPKIVGIMQGPSVLKVPKVGQFLYFLKLGHLFDAHF